MIHKKQRKNTNKKLTLIWYHLKGKMQNSILIHSFQYVLGYVKCIPIVWDVILHHKPRDVFKKSHVCLVFSFSET